MNSPLKHIILIEAFADKLLHTFGDVFVNVMLYHEFLRLLVDAIVFYFLWSPSSR